MNDLNKKITRSIWVRRMKWSLAVVSILFILSILVFYQFSISSKKIDGIVVDVTRSQTTLSSGVVLIVDIGDDSKVTVPVPSVSMPKKGQKILLLQMDSLIPGHKRYKFISYKVD